MKISKTNLVSENVILFCVVGLVTTILLGCGPKNDTSDSEDPASNITEATVLLKPEMERQGVTEYRGKTPLFGSAPGQLLDVQSPKHFGEYIVFVHPQADTSNCFGTGVGVEPGDWLGSDGLTFVYGVAEPTLPVEFLACVAIKDTANVSLDIPINIKTRLQ